MKVDESDKKWQKACRSAISEAKSLILGSQSTISAQVWWGKSWEVWECWGKDGVVGGGLGV